jgi:hypothetical protein
MKQSFKIALGAFLWWPISTTIAWTIWNRVIIKPFPFLPPLEWWQIFCIDIFLSCFIPITWGMCLSAIVDKLYGEK